MTTFTAEQLATLNTLMVDWHAIEVLVDQPGRHQLAWLYDADDQLVAYASISDLGDIRMFELMGAAA